MTTTPRTFSLNDLAEKIGGTVENGGETQLSGVGTLQGASASQISFLTNTKYKSQLAATNAGAVILQPDHRALTERPVLLHNNPHVAFAKVAQLFDTTPKAKPGIHPSAYIAETATLGKDVAIGPFAVIEDYVELGDGVSIGAHTTVGQGTSIGEHSVIHPNVTLYHDLVIGARVVIHSQTVIGSDGFGYANEHGTWIPIPQTGRVVIGDDSQIGSCTSIDRGALDDTIIGRNVIIDNQVQIAHNCVIGDHSCICGSTGMAGSVTIGKYVIIAGSCGINGHISICDKVQITGFTMVTNNITEPGVYSSGQPAMPNMEWRKLTVRNRQLEKLVNRVKALEENR